jgi:N6-adenosine-specific RNA methylase IME4
MPTVEAFDDGISPRSKPSVRHNWPFGTLKLRAYRVILIDPPCAHASGPNRNPTKHYRTLKLPDIAALPVGDLAHPDGARLFLWLPMNRLHWMTPLLAAWRFKFCSARPWLKLWPKKPFNGAVNAAMAETAGLEFIREMVSVAHGYEILNSTEMLVTAKRGRPQTLGDDKFTGVIIARRREHSRKPECVRDEIVKLLDGPRCELFARSHHPGFEAWGDQLDLFDDGGGTI